MRNKNCFVYWNSVSHFSSSVNGIVNDVPLMTIWYVVICGWKILSEFHLYHMITLWAEFFARVNKQSTSAQGEYENDFRAHSTVGPAAATNESAMLHLHNSLGGGVDLSKENIQFIHAIRIKIFNIVVGKIPDDFQYQPPLSAEIRFVSSPCGCAGAHSSFRNMASFMKHSALLSSHRRYEGDRRINLPTALPDSWRNMQTMGKEQRVFYFAIISLLVFIYFHVISLT